MIDWLIDWLIDWYYWPPLHLYWDQTGLYLAKCGIADAYRIVPIHPDGYPKLGMRYKGRFYYDKNLPQGCRSSCNTFEEFSTTMQAIFQFYYPSAVVQHTIDDFLFIALTRVACQELLDGFDWLCRDIGVPLASSWEDNKAGNLGCFTRYHAWLVSTSCKSSVGQGRELCRRYPKSPGS